MKYTEKISEQLNDLLVKNYDAEKGYIQAADKVENPTLESFFRKRALERGDFARELKTEISQYGEDPKDSGSVTGSMHRGWMSVKSLLSTDDSEAMLEEAIRGEESSLEEYNEVLNETALPPSVENMLNRHKNTIQSAINSVKVREELVS